MTTRVLFFISLVLLLPIVSVYGEEEEMNDDMQVLRMFYPESDLVVTPTRAPKRISHVAENITVITAKDIEEINAHTLADVLNIIPGVQIQLFGGPGTLASGFIQGAPFRYILVLIDGVPQNNLSDHAADTAAIPVQQIERIEIIKGPGSSAWGSSLGGVINILTKEPNEDKKASGVVSGSFGERNTGDYRGEASGTAGAFGYYLSGGKLRSDGFGSNIDVDKENFYSKFKWQPTDRTTLRLTFGYDNGKRGDGEVLLPPAAPVPSFANDFLFQYQFATVGMTSALSDRVDLDLQGWEMGRDFRLRQTSLGSGQEIGKTFFDEKSYGGSAKLTWRRGKHQLLVGSDVVRDEIKASGLDRDRSRTRSAVFVNDSIIIGPFSVTPGLRYDYNNVSDDFLSPSLGATYAIGDHTVLRTFVVRGFNAPSLPLVYGFDAVSPGSVVKIAPNANLEMEKAWSYQAGAETSILKIMWLKTNLFYHDISDALTTASVGPDTFVTLNEGKLRLQGVEVEAKTVPFHHVSLSGGVTFVDGEDPDTGKTIRGIPRHTYDVGFHYDNDRVMRATLIGHYIWFNETPERQASYDDFVWDLHLSRSIVMLKGRKLEAFFSGRNLFSGGQYSRGDFKNPQRWVEGGVRIKF